MGNQGGTQIWIIENATEAQIFQNTNSNFKMPVLHNIFSSNESWKVETWKCNKQYFPITFHPVTSSIFTFRELLKVY